MAFRPPYRNTGVNSGLKTSGGFMAEITHWLAAVDYVRMSWRAGSMDEEQYSLLWPRLLACAQEATGVGIEVETVKMLGYIGLKAGPLFLGLSYQGAMLQASGLAAQLVCELGLIPDNVSRMDLQATVWLSEDDEGLARRVADDVETAYEGRRGRKPAVRYIDGYGRGNTAYVGSRGKRAVFIRVYDKARETGEAVYARAWRYEAELTDEYAREAYYTALEARFGEPMTARLLMGYLELRGVALSLPREVRGFDRASLPRGVTTKERRLAWLAKQVRPTVERLMLDGVSREELVSLLGLSG